MLKILFICHGNICRSPMSEFIFRDMVRKRGLSDCFSIASAATSREEIGNPVYPPARRILKAHGIDCSGKTARQMTRRDYDRFDMIIGMDQENLGDMRRICGGDPEKKISLLLDYTDHPRDVADPWYTRNFDETWEDVNEGCRAVLDLCLKSGI